MLPFQLADIFSPFIVQGFLEIAFCAIKSSEQAKGYGTYLMNCLKNHAQTIPVDTFLTHADNDAIEYFQKQVSSAFCNVSQFRGSPRQFIWKRKYGKM
jgi:histone acetyltransferase